MDSMKLDEPICISLCTNAHGKSTNLYFLIVGYTLKLLGNSYISILALHYQC